MRGHVLQLVRRSEYFQHDFSAPVVQMASSHHAPAAIVTSSAKNCYEFSPHVSTQHPAAQPGQASSGVLHHLDELDAVFFNHQAVYFDHLLCGDSGDLHIHSSWTWGTFLANKLDNTVMQILTCVMMYNPTRWSSERTISGLPSFNRGVRRANRLLLIFATLSWTDCPTP